MLSLGVSRCAGRIGNTYGKHTRTHMTSMLAVLVLATCLKHADSVVVAAYDLRWYGRQTHVQVCRVSMLESLQILKASGVMACEHVFVFICLEDLYNQNWLRAVAHMCWQDAANAETF